MLDFFKEIISMVLDVINYAKGATNSKDDANGNMNGTADKKSSYFS